MNPLQLRETTMATDTRRLVQLTAEGEAIDTTSLIDMLLAKNRASDRTRLAPGKGQPRRHLISAS